MTVSLSTGVKTISSGQRIKMTVLMKMESGWHIYYKDPGETGMPPQVLWDLPKGFVAESLQWQPHEKFVESGITTYGYKNSTAITAVIVAPQQLRAGQSNRIAATVKWLACKNSCVPGSASVALSLPTK